MQIFSVPAFQLLFVILGETDIDSQIKLVLHMQKWYIPEDFPS